MSTQNSTLVFIPTYNERENVSLLCEELVKLNLPIDILFVDDNSPDGTGQVIEELAKKYSQVKTAHRKGKLGVGSAHRDGIKWAYNHKYSRLITMDCDFTHPPKYIPEILNLAQNTQCDVAVGSRYLKKDSLAGWNPLRFLLTNMGHFMTKFLLGLPHDATSGFRFYNLDKIPERTFELITSKGYSFFFESLYILFLNKFKISELAIDLPPRTYGHSKMDISEVQRSIKLLFTIYLTKTLFRERFILGEAFPDGVINAKLNDEQGWEDYWNNKEVGGRIVYDLIAALYRRMIIKPALNHFINKSFKQGDKVLHAGCGSGQVDTGFTNTHQVTGLDLSVNALKLYQKVNPKAQIIHGSIFEMPVAEHSFDGIYNLGVMEHFTESEIAKILSEFKRVLKPGGKMLLFWPPEFGISVIFLKGVKWFLESVMGKKGVKIHPDEITRIQSVKHLKNMLSNSGLTLSNYHFGMWSFFTYSIVVVEVPAQLFQPNPTDVLKDSRELLSQN